MGRKGEDMEGGSFHRYQLKAWSAAYSTVEAACSTYQTWPFHTDSSLKVLVMYDTTENIRKRAQNAKIF